MSVGTGASTPVAKGTVVFVFNVANLRRRNLAPTPAACR